MNMDILLVKIGERTVWRELEGFLGCLSPAARKSVLRKSSEADKINSLVSRLLALSEITRRTGVPGRKLAFGHGPHGKPYLKDDSLQFSLSHTAGAVCAAFSENGEIGVDIERRDRRVSEALYKRALSDGERLCLNSSEDFLRFWVQKEAFLKRLGIGITKNLRGVNSLELPDTAAISCGEYLVGVSGKGAQCAAVREAPLGEVLSRFVLEV